jgi:Retrotransposon gag protein
MKTRTNIWPCLKNCVTRLKLMVLNPRPLNLEHFLFSLGDKARNWLRSLDTGTIRTWAQMSDAFLSKYFPASKTYALRSQITNFRQR